VVVSVQCGIRIRHLDADVHASGLPGVDHFHVASHVGSILLHVGLQEASVVIVAVTSLGVLHALTETTISLLDDIFGKNDLTSDQGIEGLFHAFALSVHLVQSFVGLGGKVEELGHVTSFTSHGHLQGIGFHVKRHTFTGHLCHRSFDCAVASHQFTVHFSLGKVSEDMGHSHEDVVQVFSLEADSDTILGLGHADHVS
jgi:hypothetical protein